ncbi:MAG: 4Fe-4S binding protein [Nitrospira sp.]|nr:4Fe-4S binding protein [Nitrospira sp.]
MRILRKTTQGIFLLLFIFLFIQTESTGVDELGYPVKFFLDFDPLILITTFLASHSLEKGFYLSLSVILMTLIFGRIFCGWVCPFGTIHNMVGALKRHKGAEAQRGAGSLFRVKYFVLLFLLGSSLFTLQLAGVMDPIALLIRSFSISIYPAFNYMTRAFFDTVYEMDPKGLVDLSETAYTGLKGSVLAFKQPYFKQAGFIGLIFIIIIALNLYQKRFWCRNLCPLGALLGLLSKYSILKREVSEGCNECGVCSKVCQSDARPNEKGHWVSTECLYCWDCDDVCPQKAVSFGFNNNAGQGTPDLGRRRVLTSIGAGVVAVPLLRTTPLSASDILSPELIRPPGALAEKKFLERCIKCGECMKVCITNGLQPTFLEAGLEGIWSPILIPQTGYCEYRCTLCGQVCPTGAIKKLPLEEKVNIKIGLANINKSRCLPYAHATQCIVCEEVCPTPKKAIWFEYVKVNSRELGEFHIQQPKVDLKLCIGCGICEKMCPVVGTPAITVTSTGESRSDNNQMIL